MNTRGYFVHNKKNGKCPNGDSLSANRYSTRRRLAAAGDRRRSRRYAIVELGDPRTRRWLPVTSRRIRTSLALVKSSSRHLPPKGVAVFASTGDNGAWECSDPNTGTPLGIACPAILPTDPDVTAVGGVNIPILDNGRLGGQIPPGVTIRPVAATARSKTMWGRAAAFRHTYKPPHGSPQKRATRCARFPILHSMPTRTQGPRSSLTPRSRVGSK